MDTPRIEFVVYPTGALLAIAEQLRDVGAHQTMHLEGRLRPGSLGEAMMELGEAVMRREVIANSSAKLAVTPRFLAADDAVNDLMELVEGHPDYKQNQFAGQQSTHNKE